MIYYIDPSAIQGIDWGWVRHGSSLATGAALSCWEGAYTCGCKPPWQYYKVYGTMVCVKRLDHHQSEFTWVLRTMFVNTASVVERQKKSRLLLFHFITIYNRAIQFPIPSASQTFTSCQSYTSSALQVIGRPRVTCMLETWSLVMAMQRRAFKHIHRFYSIAKIEPVFTAMYARTNLRNDSGLPPSPKSVRGRVDGLKQFSS